MDKLIIFIILLALIFLLVAVCGLVALIFFSQSNNSVPNQAVNVTNVSNNTSVVQNQTANNSINATDLQLWMMINNANVQSACLSEAKTKAGTNAWGVKGCTCQENANDIEKIYTCNIATLDPTTNYFANIDCLLQNSSCTIQTNFGTQSVTFDQLRQLYNTS